MGRRRDWARPRPCPTTARRREGIIACLAESAGLLGDDPTQIDAILGRLPAGSQSARTAIDIALHDLMGKRLGQPLYRMLGLDPARCPETSFTVAMDEPAAMAERARESGFPIIKIKLGSGDDEADEATVRAIREATAARLTADANAGWTFEQAARLIPRLAQYGLELHRAAAGRGRCRRAAPAAGASPGRAHLRR